MSDSSEQVEASVHAEEIVRRLAKTAPITENDDMYHWCTLCDAGLPLSATDHEPTCPWRLAHEWVEQHPADDHLLVVEPGHDVGCPDEPTLQ